MIPEKFFKLAQHGNYGGVIVTPGAVIASDGHAMLITENDGDVIGTHPDTRAPNGWEHVERISITQHSVCVDVRLLRRVLTALDAAKASTVYPVLLTVSDNVLRLDTTGRDGKLITGVLALSSVNISAPCWATPSSAPAQHTQKHNVGLFSARSIRHIGS